MAVSRHLPRDREAAIALLKREIASIVTVEDAVRLTNKLTSAYHEGIITYEDLMKLDNYARKIIDELNRLSEKGGEASNEMVSQVKDMLESKGFEYLGFAYDKKEGKYVPYVKFCIKEDLPSFSITVSREEIVDKYNRAGIKLQPLEKLEWLIEMYLYYEKLFERFPKLKEKLEKYLEYIKASVEKGRELLKLEEVS